MEFQQLQQLKNDVSSLKTLIEYTYEDGTTTLETLKELLDSDNVSNLHDEAYELNKEYKKYFEIQEDEELSLSQKLNELNIKSKELYSYLFNNNVTVKGIETSREQAIKNKYQKIDEYYNYIFNDETDESGEQNLSFSSKFEKQKASLDKFYVKIFGDDKNPALDKTLNARLDSLDKTEKEALKVLNLSSNAGLAGGFFEKGEQAKMSKQNNLYVFIGALILLASFNFFTIDFNQLDKITITSITVRLILNIPLIWIATVANLNLNRYSKLEQEYGHKEALARSFEKYKAEIKNLNADSRPLS